MKKEMVGFEGFVAVSMKMAFFRAVALLNLVEIYKKLLL